MSIHSHNIKTEIYGITQENIRSKLEPHFNEVIEYISLLKLSNIKINTKIEGASVQTDIWLLKEKF